MEEKDLPYLNTSIDDMEGEIWVDAFGFDGYYEVSNLGRIKSVSEREVRFGKNIRKMPVRILKQSISKIRKKRGIDNRLTCGFSIDNKRITINVPRMIYQSFFPDENIDNLVISHKNRCEFDNRLKNLISETVKKNHNDNVNKYNIKGIKDLILENTKKTHESFVENVKSKTCKDCGITKDVSEFSRKQKGKRDENRNVCKKCRQKRYLKRLHERKGMPKDRRRKIAILKNGEVLENFNSITEMVRKYDLNKGGVNQVLKGNHTHHKGFTFSYIEQ